MDSRHWRRAGFLPATEIAAILNVPPITFHRYLDKGQIPFERQGRYRFVSVKHLVVWIRGNYTDRVVANSFVTEIREAAKIKNDPGAKRVDRG
jgi:hypothetical protein